MDVLQEFDTFYNLPRRNFARNYERKFEKSVVIVIRQIISISLEFFPSTLPNCLNVTFPSNLRTNLFVLT